MQTLGAVTLVRSIAEQRCPVTLASALVDWLSYDGLGVDQAQRAAKLQEALTTNPKHSAAIAQVLFSWLSEVNIYPALVSSGLFSRRGFLREMASRLYERINPAPRDQHDFKDMLVQMFNGKDQPVWLADASSEAVQGCFAALCANADAGLLQKMRGHFQEECLYALEMLGIWVAAEEIEPDLMRLDRRLSSLDSPFIALSREMNLFVQSGRDKLHDPDLPLLDTAHLDVMIEQSRDQLERLRRRGAGVGSSVSVAHLLERLEQTLDRIVLLVDLLQADTPAQGSKLFSLFSLLAQASTEQNSIGALWRSSTQMLSKSITVNKSGHGEHYIARDKSSFFALMRSAAGAGVIIALMALLKIYIQQQNFSPFYTAVLASLNYGLGFVLIHMLHFVIATKQPAMTAASFAQEVERGENGRAVNKKLAALLIDVNRSQWAAVWGNVSVAIMLACTIALVVRLATGSALLTPDIVAYQLKAVSPVSGLALFYAAIAGLWLFCSGIIAGFFDNRANCLELRLRLYQHPLLKKLLPDAARQKFADYLHNNYGALAGNFLFGVLLGMTGYVGYLSGLPLDIRHVAFSSANLGYSAVSGEIGILSFLVNLLFVLLIGFVNLWVSFTLALTVALRARGTSISKLPLLLKSLWEHAKQQPLNLFFPVNAIKQTVAEATKAAEPKASVNVEIKADTAATQDK
ncbi:MAG: site-specific recombinase [Gammaproteobacteria bacterium]|nr:site-specific recombinase [Gammaproteobacteria bacterium]MBU1553740.1 site-specific recombinase [Gammaproteobacteria bacterium]MBU2070667.1 site-specific recombinase [Gammaproteobacteria bacterium]MBU2184239.1 site-specific recombinase [Gammaproteobacteria bacterium]MBU2206100.1 site-specific recombinase [Gammaproteobacteria bacterium]